MRLSQRVLKTQSSPIRKLYPLAVKAEKRGIKVIQLNIGQPDLKIPKIVFNKIKNCPADRIPYAPSRGIKELIDVWQKYLQRFNLKFKKEEIIVTTGASEAIVFAMASIADPGEEIIVFEPFYANYAGFASINSIKLVPITLKIDNGFHLPEKKLIESKINKKTRGIIICNPNNPTGAVYTKEEMKIIASLAKKYNLFIINDEVYREFVFQKKLNSIFNFKEILQNIILIDSVSKRFNLCGARIGCLASKNKNLMENVLKFAQARLSSPTFEQSIVVPILNNSRKYTNLIINEYKKRRKAVQEELKKIPGITYCFPEGAFYIIIKLPVKSSEKFCEWLLKSFNYKKKTIMLAPAEGFYKTPGKGKNEVRLAFVYNEKILRQAIRLLGLALKKYKI